MVINTHEPYDFDTESSDGDDPWEIIDDAAPLFAAAAQLSSGSLGGAVEQAEGADELESRQEEAIAQGAVNGSVGDDDSFPSGLSSITVDHAVSDKEAEKGDNDKEAQAGDAPPVEQNEAEAVGPTDPSPDPRLQFDQENEAPAATAPPRDVLFGDARGAKGFPTALVETLSQMGFGREQVEKSIGDLLDSGTPEDEINADSVIGEMMGEKAGGGAPDGSLQSLPSNAWDFIESSIQDFDNQHQIRRRTRDCMQTVGRSAQEFWSSVKEEQQRFQSDLRETRNQADFHAREATKQARYKASSAKDSICRANEQYGISEKLAAAAALTGTALLVLGNPRAGVVAMAVAGATLATGEAIKQSSAQSNSTHTRDYGLDEGLHLD